MKFGYQLKAQRLKRENHTVPEIASMLGCSQHDVRLALNCHGQAFMRKVAARIRKPQKIKSSPLKDETLGARSAGIGAELRQAPIPRDLLLDRDRRMMLAPHSLTAALMGDPLPGGSALDHRTVE